MPSLVATELRPCELGLTCLAQGHNLVVLRFDLSAVLLFRPRCQQTLLDSSSEPVFTNHSTTESLSGPSHAGLVGLQIGTKKTRVMTVANASPPTVKLDNNTLETVESFTYLGSQMAPDGSTEKEVKEWVRETL